MQRVIYLVFILLLIAVSLPVMILAAAAVYMASGKPVLFRQKRVGKDGKPFTLYKFRTMVPDAESMQRRLLKKNEANGPVFKIFDDPRFTPIGKFLSHTGLDELPQLFNVLRGDMALIGPRPLPVAEAQKLAAWMRKRERIKPGIISPWILNGYHLQPFDAWMESDIAYADSKSLPADIRLTARSAAFLARLFVQQITDF